MPLMAAGFVPHQEKVKIHMWKYGAHKPPLKLPGIGEIKNRICGAVWLGEGL